MAFTASKTAATIGCLLVLLVAFAPTGDASIGYFESYGWPSYGIVKPFWMAPFSAHPSRPVSPYSRRHNVVSAGVVEGPQGQRRRR